LRKCGAATEGARLPPLFVNGEIDMIARFDRCIILSRLGSLSAGSTLYEDDVLGTVDSGVDVPDYNANFSLDPLFCGVEGSGNFFLQSHHRARRETGHTPSRSW
jgi:hypothetical protein